MRISNQEATISILGLTQSWCLKMKMSLGAFPKFCVCECGGGNSVFLNSNALVCLQLCRIFLGRTGILSQSWYRQMFGFCCFFFVQITVNTRGYLTKHLCVWTVGGKPEIMLIPNTKTPSVQRIHPHPEESTALEIFAKREEWTYNHNSRCPFWMWWTLALVSKWDERCLFGALRDRRGL